MGDQLPGIYLTFGRIEKNLLNIGKISQKKLTQEVGKELFHIPVSSLVKLRMQLEITKGHWKISTVDPMNPEDVRSSGKFADH